MKKILALLGVSLILASCGGSEINSDAFCDGDILIPFQEKKDKDWGFININGEVVIDPEFDFQPSYAENGIALIMDKSKKDEKYFYRFVKIEGGKAVESDKKWDLAGEFKEGLAPVRNDNEKVQFINEDYKSVFTVEAEKVSYFNDGLAAICDEDNKWGFINKSGEEVIKPTYDFVANGFNNGYAIVGENSKEGRKFQIIDQSGVVKLNLKDKYESVMSISSGLVKVMDEEEYGFIDLEGNKVVRMNDEWSFVSDFINGFATYKEDDEWGLIDLTGAKKFKAKYQEPLIVVGGSIWYKEDDQWGLMDLEGNDKIKPSFDGVAMPYPFMCGTTIVQDGEDYIFIDSEGKEINQEEYENVAGFDPMYITEQPWNRTFESDYFDVGSVKNLVANDFLNIKDVEKLTTSFELNPKLFWGKYDRRYYKEIDGMYQFYVNSSSYNFTAYEYDYYADYPEEEYAEEEYEGDYYEDGYEVEEEIANQYPKDAPNGISSVSYRFSFDDYLGVTKKMSMDAANEYHSLDTEDKKLDLNKTAKVKTARMTVNLNKKGNGKAVMLAEELAVSWKTKIKNVVEEENANGSYTLEGELTNGKIVIRTSGDSSVIVDLEYNVDED